MKPRRPAVRFSLDEQQDSEPASVFNLVPEPAVGPDRPIPRRCPPHLLVALSIDRSHPRTVALAVLNAYRLLGIEHSEFVEELNAERPSPRQAQQLSVSVRRSIQRPSSTPPRIDPSGEQVGPTQTQRSKDRLRRAASPALQQHLAVGGLGDRQRRCPVLMRRTTSHPATTGAAGLRRQPVENTFDR